MQWQISDTLVAYPEALAQMENHVAQMIAGEAQEKIWLLEHPPLYTAGTSAKAEDLLDDRLLPVFHTGRGGQYTYHGPGQRVAYLMLNLPQRMGGKPDIRYFVWLLEEWLIQTLARLGVIAERRAGRVGLWVVRADNTGEDKIAAIGIRLKKWISFHGVALNVMPNLSHYAGIVPCGILQHGVTSLHQLGVKVSMAECDKLLQESFVSLNWNQTCHIQKKD
jgi:lipoyl(octanoyl) transferase